MLSVEKGGIKYHFKSFWYDSTWDWTPVSRIIGGHSTHSANEPVNKVGDRSRGWPEGMYDGLMIMGNFNSSETKFKKIDHKSIQTNIDMKTILNRVYFLDETFYQQK